MTSYSEFQCKCKAEGGGGGGGGGTWFQPCPDVYFQK